MAGKILDIMSVQNTSEGEGGGGLIERLFWEFFIQIPQSKRYHPTPCPVGMCYALLLRQR